MINVSHTLKKENITHWKRNTHWKKENITHWKHNTHWKKETYVPLMHYYLIFFNQTHLFPKLTIIHNNN